MPDMISKRFGKGLSIRNRVTLVETTVIVGAIGAFATIYSYIVIAALNSNS